MDATAWTVIGSAPVILIAIGTSFRASAAKEISRQGYGLTHSTCREIL